MAFKILDLKQRSPEWHDFRKNKIGASMVAAILDIDPWTSRLDLWNRLILEEEQAVTPAMQRGTDLEEGTLAWFNETGKYKPPFEPKVVQSEEYPFLIASLDGIRIDHGTYELCEIKHPNRESHDLARKNEIPNYYIPQIQYQMWITDTDWMWYISGNGAERVKVLTLRDDEFIKKMIPEILAFRDSLIKFHPPKASHRDKVVLVDYRAKEKAERYKELSTQRDLIEKEMETIRSELTSICHHPYVQVGGLSIQKMYRKGNVDYASIPELEEVDLEEYRKPQTEYWKFIIEDD